MMWFLNSAAVDEEVGDVTNTLCFRICGDVFGGLAGFLAMTDFCVTRIRKTTRDALCRESVRRNSEDSLIRVFLDIEAGASNSVISRSDEFRGTDVDNLCQHRRARRVPLPSRRVRFSTF